MTNARRARAQKVLKMPVPKDTRQPIRLSAEGVTGSTILRAVSDAIKQTLEGQGVALILSGYVEGKGLEGAWGIRIKDVKLGDLYVVPRKDDLAAEEPEKAAAVEAGG